jgi:hypothetical protein
MPGVLTHRIRLKTEPALSLVPLTRAPAERQSAAAAADLSQDPHPLPRGP